MVQFTAAVPISIHYEHGGETWELNAAAGEEFTINNVLAADAFEAAYGWHWEPLKRRRIWPVPPLPIPEWFIFSGYAGQLLAPLPGGPLGSLAGVDWPRTRQLWEQQHPPSEWDETTPVTYRQVGRIPGLTKL